MGRQHQRLLALEPLVSVAGVFRSGNTHWEALPHVLSLVSAYLDGAIPSRWSMERACESGFGLRMLKRLAAHEAETTAMAASESTPLSSNMTTTALMLDPLYRAYLASKALVAAIQRADDVDVVRWVCSEYCRSVVPVKAVVEAASAGRLRVLQWLLATYPSVRPNKCVLRCAVEEGHLAVVQWLCETYASARPDKDILQFAAERGHFALLQWLVAHLERVSADQVERMLSTAARRGSLEMVGWLHELRRRQQGASALECASESRFALVDAVVAGHVDVAVFLAEQGYALDPSQTPRLRLCARAGNLELLEWLHARGLTRGDFGWLDEAAGAGHLHVVQWVHENLDWPACTAGAMDQAAADGRLELVQWLHTHRTEGCTARAMDGAACNGHLKLVQWLHAHRTEGCTPMAMDGAARHGHLDIVQWLHAHRSEGCTTRAMDEAASNGRFAVLQWLHAHRSEGCTSDAMDRAVDRGHFEIARWLHAHRAEGCTVKAMDYAASHGSLELVRWLHETRSEGCTARAMDNAAMRGHLHVVQWLHENRTEGCSTDAMDQTGSVRVLRWLREHRSEGCTRFATDYAVQTENVEKLLFLRDEGLLACAPSTVSRAAGCRTFEALQLLRVAFPAQVDTAAIHTDYVTNGFLEMFLQFERRGQGLRDQALQSA